MKHITSWLIASCLLTAGLLAQQPPSGGPPQDRGGPGGGGPMGMGQQRKLIKDFDKDGDGKLNREERQAAREFLKKQPAGRGPGPGGQRGGMMNISSQLFTALDTDKDGFATQSEIDVGIKKFFGDAKELNQQQVSEKISKLLPAGGMQRNPGKDGPPGKEGFDGKNIPPGKEGRGPLVQGQERSKQDEPPSKNRPDQGPGGGPPGGGFPGQGPGGNRMFAPGGFLANMLFGEIDKNQDGKITPTEVKVYAESRFKIIDKNKDGKLDASEFADALPMPGPGFGPGGGDRNSPKPGLKVTPSDVQSFADKTDLFDGKILRTLFIDFEDKDWEAEMADFYHSDVEVPATMTVDGKKYPEVGVRFRGASSFFTVGAGSKRSLNISMDYSNTKQKLYGHKTLNLLNSHEDGTLMSSVLFSHIASQFIPAPKANYVKVVINGENWGVYVNVEQFNNEFAKEHYKTSKGTRWKVKGSPMGGGGLEYNGDDIDRYKRNYDIKSEDNEKAWKQLVNLCKVINTTPAEKLEEALRPIVDIDNLLWFLALDIALVNCDGYWIRASDYYIYLDEKKKFHFIPHDMNEAFRQPGGPGFGNIGGGRGGMGGGRPGEGAAKAEPPANQNRNPLDLDPLFGMTDARKPLRSKVLAVPKFKEQYLRNLKTIATNSLDWEKLGPVVAEYRKLIEKEVEADTKRLNSFTLFQKNTADTYLKESPVGRGMEGMNLHAFADLRRTYLLNHAEIKSLSK